MEVPPDGRTAGWYTESPTPGERGPAVLAAHVDWKHEKGVFYDLRKLKPGDEVTVDRRDGTRAIFRVSRVAQYPKDKFPTDEVYGDVEGPQLRLITCGGDFNQDAKSYRDNIVVYADLMKTA
jgi:LPXTG-site transpeptidase (sortase) family protein